MTQPANRRIVTEAAVDAQVAGKVSATGSATRAALNSTYAGVNLPKHAAADNVLYVSKSGNDANDGRAPGSAKLTIQAAIDTLDTAGKHGEVRVGAGNYTEDITLRDGISVIGAGSNMTTITSPSGSTAPGMVQIAAGPVTGMRFEGFKLLGNGNAGQHGIYAKSTARPAPAYGDGGWWYSRIKDLTITNFTGRGIWLRGGGATYMLPHQFLVFEMVRVFMPATANKEALVLSGQVGQIDYIQCEFDTDDSPPYGSTMTVPNVYLAPQLNDNGTFADDTNAYAITFHTVTIQGGYKAVYATHPCSGIKFTNPHLEGFKYGFHADSGARLVLEGGGFDNVGNGDGTGYWTNTTIGGSISWDNPTGGGTRDKTFISDSNGGSTNNIRNASKTLVGTETTGLSKEISVGSGTLALQGNRSFFCNTSATAITAITSNAAPGESVFIEAFSGPLTFATGSGLKLGGRSSYTIPDGAVVQFTRLDILNVWALVGSTPGANTSISADYTALPIDRTILASGGAGGITVTLPVAPRGTRLDIKKSDSAAGAVTIAAGSGNTIEGAATFVLPSQNDSVALESSGTTWFVLAQVGRIRFKRGSGTNALETSNQSDVLAWGFADQKLNGYASNGSSIRVTVDTQDVPTAGRFNSALFGSGKHASYTNSGTEVYAVAADGSVTSSGSFSGLIKSKVYTTATRPSASTSGAGAQVYDSTISKPIWSDGTVWRDAALVVNAWTTVSTFSNSWTSVGTPSSPVQYRISADGAHVELSGQLTGGAADTVAFNLPTGSRPTTDKNLSVFSIGNGGGRGIKIGSNGDVRVLAGTTAPISLDGVVFPIDG